MKLLFIHGRSQQGEDPAALQQEWLDALDQGLSAQGLSLPADTEVAFPFYGDRLDDFVNQSQIPLSEDIRTKGGDANSGFLDFQAEMIEEIRQAANVTDNDVNDAYGPNPKPKGPQNWEWVQAIIRAVDSRAEGVSEFFLDTFMRDVYLYVARSGVQAVINQIVSEKLTDQPTVVVGHSFGSVVAYCVLRNDPRDLEVPLFVTVGSPLGIRPVRNPMRPLKSARPNQNWFNAFDRRDVVALYPLNSTNFPVTPAVRNYDGVRNKTSNRHGIIGYLDDRKVAKRIHDALTA